MDIVEMRDLAANALHGLEDVVSHEFGSQRTSADQIEHAVRNLLLEADARFGKPVGVRAPGDVMWNGTARVHINIKTTDLDKQFHMPNLISADNLWKILDGGEEFFLLRVCHRSGRIVSREFMPITGIAWDDLQIGALGSGQIQIRDGMRAISAFGGNREDWIREWRSRMLDFYHRETVKIGKRISKWESREVR